MDAQYGALMMEPMQKTWYVFAEPGRKAGKITDQDLAEWIQM